jgi:hypothetical protein
MALHKGAFAVLVLVLLFGSTDCLMACASASSAVPARNSAPPCHKHSSGPANEAPPACAHPLTIVDTPHASAKLAPPEFFPATFFVLPSLVPQALFTLHASPLPGPPTFPSVVLRI